MRGEDYDPVDIQNLIDIDRLEYYNSGMMTIVDRQIKEQVATAINYRGSVPTVADLPSNPQLKDMYNVEEDDINRVWIQDSNGVYRWDKYAPTIKINIASRAKIAALWADDL